MPKIVTLASVISLLLVYSPAHCADSFFDSVKEVGRSIGHATRNVTRDIGHTSRDATREVGHAFRDGFSSNKGGKEKDHGKNNSAEEKSK